MVRRFLLVAFAVLAFAAGVAGALTHEPPSQSGPTATEDWKWEH